MEMKMQLPLAELGDSHVLQDRIVALESALARIARELEPAFECPEVSFVALHRVACLARLSLAVAGR